MTNITRRGLFTSSLLTTIAIRASEAAPSRNAVLFGSPLPLPEALELRAGPLSLVFEPSLGFVRYIRYGDREVLRGIYAATRDRVWGTVPPRVSNLAVESRADSFQIKFDVTCQQAGIDFRWQGFIKATATSLRFQMDGQAHSTFFKNRIGFCVLHPLAECAGQPCDIETAAGARKSGTFPAEVAPNQPFIDLRAISHTVSPGVTAEVRFEGDIFEMEDHRNWTDANYKTYCTPLALAFPVEIKEGSRIRQAVNITIRSGNATASGPPAKGAEVLIEALNTAPIRLPQIGLGIAAGMPPLTPAELERIRVLRLAHLRVDLRLDQDYRPILDRAVTESRGLGCGLEAAVFLSSNAAAELAALATAARQARVVRWLIFHREESSTREQWLKLARQHLGPAAKIGGGSNAYFAELNRERPPVQAIDLACFSLNPQVHAFDNRSLTENLEGQGDAVRSARLFLGGRQVAVTPVTLKPRYNPQANVQPPTPAGELPARIDPRQMSLFGAAWTLGSLKYLAESGPASVTYYETHGWGGVMESAAGSPLPDKFPSAAGAVFPLYHVLADAAAFAGGMVTPLRSSDPLRAAALLLSTAGRRRILAANFSNEITVMRISGSGIAGRVRVAKLDERSFSEATANPAAFRARPGLLAECAPSIELTLGPYAVARIDAA